MMPLALANIGEEYMIRRVSGNPEVKKHLEDLGFTAGGSITVVSALGGNILTDAFGIVAMVAMTPLVTIQTMGLYSLVRHKLARRRLIYHMERVEDTIAYFD